MHSKEYSRYLPTIVIGLLLLALACLTTANGLSADEDHLIYLPIVAHNHDPSWKWSQQEAIELVPGSLYPPASVIDLQGRLHLFWDTPSAPSYIYHSFLDDAGWTSPTPVAQSLGYSYLFEPPLVDPEGNLHLVWRNWLGLGVEKPYRLLSSVFYGDSWSTETELYRTTYSNIRAMPHLDLDEAVRITVIDNRGFLTAYQLTQGNSGWEISEPITPGHLTHAVWPNNRGGIHFYGSDLSDQMYYSYWANGVFQVHNYQSSGMIFQRDTQLDGRDNLHTIWRATVPVPGGSITGLYYRCLDKNLVWRPKEVLSGDESVGSRTMTSDGVSQVAIAWENESSSTFMLELAEECDRVDTKTIPFLDSSNSSLETLAFSQTPHKFCVIARSTFGQEYTPVCADIYR